MISMKPVHSETMLLLAALCTFYCSNLVACCKNNGCNDNPCTNYNLTNAKLLQAFNGQIFIYCIDYKVTEELTEPGNLCDAIVQIYKSICDENYGGQTKYITSFYYGCNIYCCNYKYLAPFPTKTFMPTSVPSVIPVTKNNKNNIANLVSFFVLTSLT